MINKFLYKARNLEPASRKRDLEILKSREKKRFLPRMPEKYRRAR